jgi:GT2 family glycosyltransferase
MIRAYDKFPNPPVRPAVAVIVPVRNGAAHLARLVPALEAQTLQRDRFEVIIADDGSVTPPLELATEDAWLRVIPGAPTNSYCARNRGVAASNATILAFCDADCVPDRNWLRNGLNALEMHDVVAGRILFEKPKRKSAWTISDMESKNQERLVRNGIAETANLFIRRSLFDALGGFEEHMDEGGDFDFVGRAVRKGADLAFAYDALVYHPVRTSARAFLRAQWVYAAGWGERAALEGERPMGLRLWRWIPVIPVVRARWKLGLTLSGPNRAWLHENGVRLTLSEQLRTLGVIYLVLQYWRNVATIAGWFRGRRRRRRGVRLTHSTMSD